ncbi:rRNA maturation RNase YbeY [bacterium]|nr:rRNA maturation RNase YbeY [bacterium]
MAVIRAELNQSILRGGQRMPRRVVDRALSACADALKPRRETLLSVAFVSEKEMRRLNKQWRGKDKPTDVLSFESGEILICYPVARRQAADLRHSIRDEVVFLLVHGVLHAFGFDHIDPSDAKRMFPLQTKILMRLGVDPRL